MKRPEATRQITGGSLAILFTSLAGLLFYQYGFDNTFALSALIIIGGMGVLSIGSGIADLLAKFEQTLDDKLKRES